VQVALAQLLADPQTVAALIDRLPEEPAIALLKAWRVVTFGPGPAPGRDAHTQSDDATRHWARSE
jgi:hypothetical protein